MLSCPNHGQTATQGVTDTGRIDMGLVVVILSPMGFAASFLVNVFVQGIHVDKFILSVPRQTSVKHMYKTKSKRHVLHANENGVSCTSFADDGRAPDVSGSHGIPWYDEHADSARHSWHARKSAL